MTTVRPTRTRLLAALVPLALVAAACGDDDETAAARDDTAAETTETTEAAEGEAAGDEPALRDGWAELLDEVRCEDTTVGEFPRTVTHDGGEITIEAEPERIVSIEGTTSLDLLLLMGITPAAAGGDEEGPAVYPWQAHLAGGTPTDPGFDLIEKRPEVNVEAIAAARPDLIISQSGWLEGIEPRLRDLGVPIVVFEWDDSGNPPDWRDNARIVAEATGRDACDDEIVEKVEASIAETREVLEAAGATEQTYGAYTAMEGYTAYHGADDPIGQTLQDELGLTLEPADGAQTEFSLEQAGEVLTADVLFATDFFEDGAAQAFLEEPTVAPVADRVRILEPDLSAVAYYPSPLGVHLFVHELQELLG